jgi:hypothetical protein
LKLFSSEAEAPDDPRVARVLVKKERKRRFGDGYLGPELWKQLGLAGFLALHLDEDGAVVPWSRIAAVLAINRLCDPSVHGIGRSLARRKRQDERYPTVSLLGSSAAAEEQDRTASERGNWKSE